MPASSVDIVQTVAAHFSLDLSINSVISPGACFNMASSSTNLPSSTPIENIRWYANRPETEIHCVAIASKTFERADGTWLVEAATPTSGEELAQKLVDVVNSKDTGELAKLARGETPLESLKAHLSASLAEAMEAWWRDPPEHGLFRKEYQSDPADAATGSVKTSRTKPAVIMLGNTTTGEDEEGDESDTVLPKLTVEVQGLRRHEYQLQGAIFTSVKPMGHDIKVGLEGTAISKTGGPPINLPFPTKSGDWQHQVYRAAMNDSIRRGMPLQERVLPSGPLPTAATKIFRDSIVRMAAGESVQDVLPGKRRVYWENKTPLSKGVRPYGLSLSPYRCLSDIDADKTRYSAHAFSSTQNFSPPELWYPSTGDFVSKDNGRTSILRFSGCLRSRASSNSMSTPEANEMPDQKLLSLAVNEAVKQMNITLGLLERKGPNPAKRKRAYWKQSGCKEERMLAAMAAYMFREARSDQLRDVDADSTVISARADRLLLPDVPTSFEVQMTPLRYTAAPSSSKSS